MATPMNKKEKGIPVDLNQFYKIRMIIFMEETPQSNKYKQVLFDKSQVHSFSLHLNSLFKKEPNHKCGNPKCDGTLVKISTKHIKLPDDISDIHYCSADNCKC